MWRNARHAVTPARPALKMSQGGGVRPSGSGTAPALQPLRRYTLTLPPMIGHLGGLESRHGGFQAEAFMRSLNFLLMLNVLAVPAGAEPLQIHGITGYAGEYELSDSASEQDLNGKKEFWVR